MTQILMVSLAVLVQVQEFPNRPNWAHEFLQTLPHHRAKQGNSETPPSPTKFVQSVDNRRLASLVRPEGGGIGPQVGDPERGALFDKVLLHGVSLMRNGKVQGAFDYFTQVVHQRPDLDGLLRTSEFLDTLLLLGRLDDAETLLMSFVNERGSDSEEMYLRLSLLSAAKGMVVRGQDEYCRNYIMANLPSDMVEKSKLLPPARPMDPKAVLVDSCIAVNWKQKPAYAEMALRLDPANAFVANQLISHYLAVQRFSDARRVGKSILSKIADGPKRELFERQLKLNEGRPDSPLNPVTSKPYLGPPPP